MVGEAITQGLILEQGEEDYAKRTSKLPAEFLSSRVSHSIDIGQGCPRGPLNRKGRNNPTLRTKLEHSHTKGSSLMRGHLENNPAQRICNFGNVPYCINSQ
jgi:hypothetical protein